MSPRRELSEQCKRLTYEALVALGGQATRQEIARWALTPGRFTEEQLAMPGPPSRPQHPRLVDHYLSWSLTWLKREGRVVDLGGSVWRLVGDEDAVGTGRARPGCRVDPRAAYRAYLQSDAWRERRARTLAEAGGSCQLDASHQGPFDVHHNSYERLGAELPSDLVVLCRSCHGRHHGHELAVRRLLAGTPQPARSAWWRPSSWRRAS